MNERRSMSGARERRSRFSLKSASWAPLVIFIEERKMSAAQILNLKVLYYSKIHIFLYILAKKMIFKPWKWQKWQNLEVDSHFTP